MRRKGRIGVRGADANSVIPGKVIGRLVASHALREFAGVKFLLVQPVDEALADSGKAVVACDAIGANVGEFVYMAQGREATFPLPEKFNPADLTIVAIIDVEPNSDSD